MRALLTRMASDGAVEKKLAEGKFSVRAARATRELWEKERGERTGVGEERQTWVLG